MIVASTTGRIESDLNKRMAVLNLKGYLKPDMASITPGSLNFPDKVSVNSPDTIKRILVKMKKKHIKPEYEVFGTGMINYVNYLRRKGYDDDARPFFNFILGSLGTMPARRSDIDHLISTLENGSIWGAGGVGRFQKSVNEMTVELGGHVRVGLEDSLFMDSEKKIPATNARLVKRAIERARRQKRKIAGIGESREILGLT